MKNRLHFINNEHGFFLPYILLISAIMFIIITANITIYHHDQRMTQQHLEQIKIETVIQKSREKLKSELVTNEAIKTVQYSFPDGEVDIAITQLDDNEYRLHITVKTNNQSHYTIQNRMFLND